MTTFTRRAKIEVIQNAVSAPGNGNSLLVFEGPAGAYVSGCFQIMGTWTGVLTFQGSLDGIAWFDMQCTQLGDASLGSLTASSNGIFRFNAAGLYAVRVKVTTWTSGTSVTVTGSLVS